MLSNISLRLLRMGSLGSFTFQQILETTFFSYLLAPACAFLCDGYRCEYRPEFSDSKKLAEPSFGHTDAGKSSIYC